MPRAAILNSSQSKTPAGNDPWVRATIAAVAHAVDQGYTIVSSIGLNTWELVTWAAGERHGAIQLVAPVPHSGREDEKRQRIVSDFAIDPDRVEWHFLAEADSGRSPKSWWTARDEAIAELTDLCIPVSVRPGGRMETILKRLPPEKIVNEFRVPYDPAPHHERYRFPTDKIDPRLSAWPGGFLIHWTRASDGPWPGEGPAVYYADLVRSGDSYCRSALFALQRIMRERRLRASCWRIAQATPVVAFTALSPVESLPLIRWRSRWARWSFEPYGIALRADWAKEHGARPVRYANEDEWRRLPDADKPFCHRRGKSGDLWPAECEWRHGGDVDLSGLPPEALQVIVYRSSDMPLIRGLTDAPMWSMRAD